MWSEIAYNLYDTNVSVSNLFKWNPFNSHRSTNICSQCWPELTRIDQNLFSNSWVIYMICLLMQPLKHYFQSGRPSDEWQIRLCNTRKKMKKNHSSMQMTSKKTKKKRDMTQSHHIIVKKNMKMNVPYAQCGRWNVVTKDFNWCMQIHNKNGIRATKSDLMVHCATFLNFNGFASVHIYYIINHISIYIIASQSCRIFFHSIKISND